MVYRLLFKALYQLQGGGGGKGIFVDDEGMVSPAWQKFSSAHCQGRDHQVQIWCLTSKYVSFIAFRLPQGRGLSVPDKWERKKQFQPKRFKGVGGGEEQEKEDKEVSTSPQEEVEDE